MTQIRTDLIESNKWWKKDFSIDYKERDIYEQFQKFINLPQIIALTGLRRVGKTTLMYKILIDFITNNFDPKNILYFSFDEYKDADLKEIISEYENINEKNLENEKFLILFDEIQKLENWEEKIKRIYDLYNKNIKIIISGSESLFLKRKSKETLGGRIFEFNIEPLSFKEFLSFKNVKYKPIGLYEKELSKLFNEYILTQGFPELVGIKDKDIIKKYIKESIVEKVIYRDIPQLFKIKDVSILESILNIIMDDPGQQIELSGLAGELGISRQTLSSYIKYLEDSFLIKKLYNYSKNRRKIERKLKKYYPTIISPDIIFKMDAISQSKALEGIIVNQLNAEFFWRDSYKNEVDIVIPNQKPKPIEIKYGKVSTKNLIKFMKIFNINNGYIISKDKENTITIDNKKINIIPAYRYLLKK